MWSNDTQLLGGKPQTGSCLVNIVSSKELPQRLPFGHTEPIVTLSLRSWEQAAPVDQGEEREESTGQLPSGFSKHTLLKRDSLITMPPLISACSSSLLYKSVSEDD